MKEYFFEQRGTYYRTNDLRPERTTLLFIHGLSGSCSAWDWYEKAFESEYNVLSVDLRGHGKSLKPDAYDAYEIEKMADDIAALLDYLHIGRFIPISHSFGTLIAAVLLRRHPQGAAASVFLSSTYGIFTIPLTRFTRAFVRACTKLARLFVYSTKPGHHNDYYRYYLHSGDWNVRRIMADLPNVTLHVYLFCLDHVYARDLDACWKDLRIPALIVHGSRDTISPLRCARALAREIPSSTLTVLKGANHILPLGRFEEVRGIIAKYVREHV